MMHKEPAILVFDIGKTNRKCLVFDRAYNVLLAETFDINDAKDEQGKPVLDLGALTTAMRGLLHKYLDEPALDLKAFNITTYGATIVNTDADDRPVHLPWDYLRAYDDSVLSRFDMHYGDNGQVYAKTASPRLGNLNTGMQLYLLKHQQPAVFDSIHHSTWLPQWLSGHFTGQLFTENTSIGCHTLCWDFTRGVYPYWTHAEGISRLFPSMHAADRPLKVTIAGRELMAGIGLHDSSSALIPYLMSIPEPFMLLSTGSWSICLNPFNNTPLTDDELKQDCLCYLTYQGRPVKASRLNAGFRHEEAVAAIGLQHGKDLEFFFRLAWDSSLAVRMRDNAASVDIEPAVIDYYACIDAIVNDQIEKIALVSSAHIRTLFVDGGFSKNAVFMGMLRERLTGWEVRAAEVGQATAMGAAAVLHNHWNGLGRPAGLVQFS